MRYFPAKEVHHGLWIGSRADSQNPDFVRDHDIGMVVNCTDSIPNLNLPGVSYETIPLKDADDYNEVALARYPIIVREIETVLERGKGVLVHCAAGMQRSAAVVAAYLMYKYNLSASNAMKAIKDQKPETFFPRPTFGPALIKYERQLAAFGRGGASKNKKKNKNNLSEILAGANR